MLFLTVEIACAVFFIFGLMNYVDIALHSKACDAL